MLKSCEEAAVYKDMRHQPEYFSFLHVSEKYFACFRSSENLNVKMWVLFEWFNIEDRIKGISFLSRPSPQSVVFPCYVIQLRDIVQSKNIFV